MCFLRLTMPKMSFTAFSHTRIFLAHSLFPGRYWDVSSHDSLSQALLRPKLTLLAFVMNLLNILWKENTASREGRQASSTEVLEAMPWWRQLSYLSNILSVRRAGPISADRVLKAKERDKTNPFQKKKNAKATQCHSNPKLSLWTGDQ